MKNLILITFILTFYNSFGQTVITTGVNWPLGIIEKSDYLYIVEAEDNEISKIDLTLPNPSPITVVSGLSRPNHLIASGDFLYVTEYTGNRISKIDITQTNPIPVTVVSGLTTPKTLF